MKRTRSKLEFDEVDNEKEINNDAMDEEKDGISVKESMADDEKKEEVMERPPKKAKLFHESKSEEKEKVEKGKESNSPLSPTKIKGTVAPQGFTLGISLCFP